MIVVILVAAAIAAVAIVGGNHTGHGFGRDLERTGEKIQDSSHR